MDVSVWGKLNFKPVLDDKEGSLTRIQFFDHIDAIAYCEDRTDNY